MIVRPELPCRGCAARVRMIAVVRNATGATRSVTVVGRFGGRPVALGTRRLRARRSARFAGAITVRNPRLWSPRRPALYKASLEARAGGRRVARYRLHSGIKSVEVSPGGRLLLNGLRVNLRGVGYHEDDRENGFAIGAQTRERLIAETKAIGATMMRTHYPPHPHLHELADREGILLWSEVPVYSVKHARARPAVRARSAPRARPSATSRPTRTTRRCCSGPSATSSTRSRAAGIGAYFRLRGAARAPAGPDAARRLRDRLLPHGGLPERVRPARRDRLQRVLRLVHRPGRRRSSTAPGCRGTWTRSAAATRARRCSCTEFGAEANRDGPAEEKGTWAFQQDFVRYHLGVMARKPWLNGAIYWALNEFRIRPGWEGGNPRPAPPVHQKGLLRYGTWERKPAWQDVRAALQGDAGSTS